MKEAFNYFDKDSSGFISEDELYQVMKKFKRSTTRESVRKMLEIVDTNNDGQISFEEFIQIMTNNE
jgi:Ca2+-binding EF-hand superfamily protein